MSMQPTALRIVPLTQDAFEPFGRILDLPSGEAAERRDRVVELDDLRGGLAANVALIRAPASSVPTTIDRFERHPFSTQIFAPLGMAARFLVIVAPSAEGRPLSALARAFLCDGARGVAYAPGVWHHPLLSLVPCRFLMLVHEDGGPSDTEWHPLATPLLVDPELP